MSFLQDESYKMSADQLIQMFKRNRNKMIAANQPSRTDQLLLVPNRQESRQDQRFLQRKSLPWKPHRQSLCLLRLKPSRSPVYWEQVAVTKSHMTSLYLTKKRTLQQLISTSKCLNPHCKEQIIEIRQSTLCTKQTQRKAYILSPLRSINRHSYQLCKALALICSNRTAF